MKANTVLSALNLRKNHIDDGDATVLAEALKTNRNAVLVYLNLKNDRISDAAKQRLRDAE